MPVTLLRLQVVAVAVHRWQAALVAQAILALMEPVAPLVSVAPVAAAEVLLRPAVAAVAASMAVVVKPMAVLLLPAAAAAVRHSLLALRINRVCAPAMGR